MLDGTLGAAIASAYGLGGPATLTGPVARGDAQAVARHLAALAEVDPVLAEAYRTAALRTAQRAHAPEEVFEVLER